MAKLSGGFLGDLTEKELSAIGTIAVESAYLESQVEQLICKLSNLSMDHGTALINSGMLEAKLTILTNVAAIRLAKRPKKFAELKKIISDIRTNNETRTVAIHGIWLTQTFDDFMAVPPRRIPTAVKHNRKAQTQREVNIHDAINAGEKIKKLRDELFVFAKATWPTRKR